MARAPNKKVNKAYELFKEGYKLKDIASKLEVAEGTVRSWKKRYNWSDATQRKNKCNVAKEKNSKKVKNKEPIVEEVREVLENTELTDKQRLFCIYYIKYFNATKAYQKAYNSSYIVANSEGYKLLVNPCIKSEIEKLKQHKFNQVMLSEEDIFQKYIDIAFSDITDYVTFGRKEIEVAKDKEDNPVMIEVNYVDFKNSNEVDGTIVSEVSQGKNGVSIKLQDKMKALQWLSDRMDLLPTDTKIKLENEKKRLDHIINKGTGADNREEDIARVLKEALEDI